MKSKLKPQTKFIWIALTFTVALSVVFNNVKAQAPVAADPYLGIIPAPASVIKDPGTFDFTKMTLIKADNPNDRSVALLKSFLINNRHFNNRISKYSSKNKTIKGTGLILTSKGADKLPNEGYKLTITSHRITIIGKGAGLFYGIQTLIQLFPVEQSAINKLPCAVIADEPRFGYRGMMLDVSRHFFNVHEVEKILDVMAAYKLNNFHWHLTDGQGWRIEIKKYPKLTEIGGYRMQTMFGVNRDWPDKLTYGGFYTQDDIRAVVKYAAERYINVVPEIEMPAHSDAALRAYPELKCDTTPGTPAARAINGIYCPTEETFTFLENVLTEVMELFPSKYIHIGGDEANKQPWHDSPFCQNLMKEKGLKDEKELQSYFISRIEKFINSKGRSIIGWDEILEGGLAPNATVMSWTGEEGGINAAKQKHNVIMSPQTTGNYFDHYQSSSPQEPVSFGRYAVLPETYNYNPVSSKLSPDEQKYVIGTQGNLWTEYVPTVAKIQYQIFPRLFALSEVAWTKVENKDYNDFANVRLAKHFARLDAMDYDYRVPTALTVLDTIEVGPQFVYTLKSVIPGAKIYYTLNGRDPLDTDLQYDGPITFTIPENEKRELRTRVITPSGRRSIATRTEMINRAMLPALNYSLNQHGLKYKLIKGTFTSPDQLDYVAAKDTATALKPDAEQFKKDNPNFGLIFEGYLNVPADGSYNFSLASYANTELFIDGEKLTESEYVVPLIKGFHKIKVNYIYNAPPAPAAGSYRVRQVPFRVFVTDPGAPAKKELDAANLYY
jgi:hexosaminidase